MNADRRKDLLYQATGFVVLGSFMLMIFALLFHEIPEANRELIVHVLGIIEGAFVGNLVNYFFGGSMEQQKKHEDARDMKIEEVTVTSKSKNEGEE